MTVRRTVAAAATFAVVSGAIVAAGALVPAGAAPTGPAAAAAAAPSASRLPAVYPVPQTLRAHGSAVPLGHHVALVIGIHSDPAAVTATRTALVDAGVWSVDTVSGPGQVPAGETAVFVGAGDENAAGASALHALGVGDATALPAEGYVLADGRADGANVVVLDGHDATGTFYAAQTLRQLITAHGAAVSVPGVEVRDHPDQALRGVIEGFYGTPWSDAQRLAQMDFYGAHKMNIYVYSPKNDPYLRDQWRDPYPSDKLAVLKALVARAAANHVQFTYALSPGLSVCYSSAADEKALVAKFQSLWDIGVRTFSIPLDDISYTKWNCAADATKFGTGGAAAGHAQSYLLNAVQRDFIATHAGAARLQMVPTEYSDVADSPYKTAIRTSLDPAVVVGWTGVGVIAPTITTADAAAAKSVYGHDILLWDNYPVNDYVTDRLLLGPYVGRDPGISSGLYGTTANPMIQPEASKIALFDVADFTWNGAAYDPTTSWQASLTELAGGDPQARTALAAFADLEYSSRIDATAAPVLSQHVDAFWAGWRKGDVSTAAQLDAYLHTIQWAPTTLRQRMNDAEFVTETTPWLASATAWAQASRAAVRMLLDQRAGRRAAALDERKDVEKYTTKAKSYTYVGLTGTVHVTVGDGVFDTFVTDALAANDEWLGLSGRHAIATTSLGTYQTYQPANMTDGNPDTYYWSDGPPAAGDTVGVDLGTAQPITGVDVTMGDAASPNDYLHDAVLEYSTDGSTWTPAGTFTGQAHITATLPAGTTARYVRLRATEADDYWVKVHEFAVSTPESAPLTVSGRPAAAPGAPLGAAADGDVDTVYRAASSPVTGDALIVTLPAPRALSRVVVVATGRAAVQIRTGSAWATIGRLASSGYTALPAGGRTATGVRLLWDGGSPAPTVAEIVPQRAA